MNKIELLPKDICYNDDLYQLKMWVTAWGKLCIGYPPMFKTDQIDNLFSVCIEPDREPHTIVDRNSNWINAGVGNAVSIDDACDEILNYIEKNKEDFKCY